MLEGLSLSLFMCFPLIVFVVVVIAVGVLLFLLFCVVSYLLFLLIWVEVSHDVVVGLPRFCSLIVLPLFVVALLLFFVLFLPLVFFAWCDYVVLTYILWPCF